MLRKIYKILILPYALLLLYLMLFGFGREQMDEHVVRLSPFISTIKFVQHNLLFGNWVSIIINLIGNIFMFVPFGFLGWANPRCKGLSSTLIFFLSFLVVVEATQYFSRMGVLDIDDFLLNTIGVCIGFFFKKFLEKRGV